VKQSPWGAFEEILRAHCQLVGAEASIDPDRTFVLLGVDSIELLNIMFDCEERFSIEFTVDMLTSESLTTPAQFWLSLKQIIGEGQRELELCMIHPAPSYRTG